MKANLDRIQRGIWRKKKSSIYGDLDVDWNTNLGKEKKRVKN
jgi:hypothetical protein